MGKPGRPGRSLDDYPYRQARLENRQATGVSMDDLCVAEAYLTAPPLDSALFVASKNLLFDRLCQAT